MDIFNKETFIEIVSQHSYLNKIYLLLITRKAFLKIFALCLMGIILVGFSLISAGVTVGFDVKYADEVIATVKDAAVFNDAKILAVNAINSNNAEKIIKTPEFRLTLTVADRFDNALRLADALIEKNSSIVKASALTVNGETVACVCGFNIDDYLAISCQRFNVDGAENNSFFVDDVKTSIGYFLNSDIVTEEEVKKYIDNLPVKTVSSVITDTEIPFNTKTVKTAEKLIGYSEVTTAGETGVQRKTEEVELLNGVEISRKELQWVTIKEPVTEVTTVGTAKSTATAVQRSFAGKAGFICPLNKDTYRVSAYYGDGRGHKGVDLAADKGTSIFAAAAGTVVYAGFSGDYGYSVIIDHGNGIKTRYAHDSILCVKNGDIVKQGDLIALVGKTGWATGNHLHFEVIVNGVQVDPSPFIGIG